MQEWTKKDILEAIKKKESPILYFYTPLCGTCRVAGRMLDIIEEMNGKTIYKADLNYIPEIAELFKIESVPCLLILNRGAVSRKIYAFRSIPYLVEILKEYG
ncbi:thioredoxin family protein [Siminovitchia sp. 179-K 8D1 HS]|uniref:thioredoxin family protein n=1 Tax=Siminovitchia sp. 179-K 8D1 HS TaxID=3142385 RepID=UPI0039A0B4A3